MSFLFDHEAMHIECRNIVIIVIMFFVLHNGTLETLVYKSLFYIMYLISYRPNLSVCILCYVTDLHADRDSVMLCRCRLPVLSGNCASGHLF